MEIKTSLKDLSYQFAQCFSDKDLKGLSDLIHEDFALYDPALKWVRGKEKVLEVLKEELEKSATVSYEVIQAFQEGQTTILRFELVMHDNKFVGVDFIKWQDEKMTELICYYNPLEK